MADINQLLKDYLAYLEIEKNRSPKTQKNYERYLKAFFSFSKIKTEKDITQDKVRDFRLFLSKQQGAQQNEPLQKNTQSYYIIAIRNFLKYLAKNNYDVLASDNIELPKIPERQIKILEYKDLERLLSAPSGNDLKSLRDKAILEVLFSTGLRVSELCALDRYLDLERGEVSVRGKGGKIRLVFLSDRARKAIKNYLDKRNDTEETMFISLTKAKEPKIIGRIIPRTIERLVEHYAIKAGITTNIHPHTIRHAFATDLLIGGADLRSVQEILGHQNVSTTQIYTHLTNQELREVHQAFHGRRRKELK
ncbi:MAG: site-specific tyrosine recombinase/integron integrase [Candidatus Paceibacterota bacterium]|jgi:site-specific recombinase XerD